MPAGELTWIGLHPARQVTLIFKAGALVEGVIAAIMGHGGLCLKVLTYKEIGIWRDYGG